MHMFVAFMQTQNNTSRHRMRPRFSVVRSSSDRSSPPAPPSTRKILDPRRLRDEAISRCIGIVVSLHSIVRRMAHFLSSFRHFCSGMSSAEARRSRRRCWGNEIESKSAGWRSRWRQQVAHCDHSQACSWTHLISVSLQVACVWRRAGCITCSISCCYSGASVRAQKSPPGGVTREHQGGSSSKHDAAACSTNTASFLAEPWIHFCPDVFTLHPTALDR
jgi:hypothetical protein